MPTIALAPYTSHSEGAKLLSSSMNIPLLSRGDVYLWGGRDHVLINWGNGEMNPPMPGTRIINKPMAVSTCIDKRFLFRLPPTFSRPPHTEDINEAGRWVEEGKQVLARTNVQGCDGDGICWCIRGQEIPWAKLYTAFIPCDKEYRAHVMFGKVIARQERVRRSDWRNGYDDQIRTTSGGYGFNVVDYLPEKVSEAALKCFAEFELDFGALDIVYNSSEDKAYVLEINSAPEMTPYTTEKYKERLQTHVLNEWGPTA